MEILEPKGSSGPTAPEAPVIEGANEPAIDPQITIVVDESMTNSDPIITVITLPDDDQASAPTASTHHTDIPQLEASPEPVPVPPTADNASTQPNQLVGLKTLLGKQTTPPLIKGRLGRIIKRPTH